MTFTKEFKLPDHILSTLPTGAVKDVVNSLGERIANGEFQPLSVLPQEDELSREFGVSRTALREAVKVLSGKGLLRTARRYGTRVRPFEEWHLLDPDVVRWHGPSSPMAARIYQESTDLRCIVEPEAAALAATNASDKQVTGILEAAKAIRPEPFGLPGMIAADYAFHSAILSSTGNIMLAQLDGLILALLLFSYPTGAEKVPSVQVSWKEHFEVARAIEQRKPDLARKRMKAMLKGNRIVAESI